MRKNLIAAVTFALAVVIGLSSCSRTEELLANVPASSNGIMCINVENLLAVGGIEIKEGSLVLPAGVNIQPRTRERLEKMLPALSDAIDFADIVVAMPDNRNMFATFLLKDQEILRNTLESAGATNLGVIADCQTYSIDNSVYVYIGDGQGWVIFSSPNYTPKDIAEATRNGNFKKQYPAIATLLGENKMVSVAATGRAMNFGNESWMVANLENKENNLVMTTRRIDEEGKVIDNDMLRELDPAALKLIPGNAALYLAAGITKDIDWKAITMVGTLIGGFQMGGMLESIIPYISKTDGTIEFSALPAGDDAWSSPSISEWDFLFAAQMNAADGAEAVKAARNYLGGMLPVSDEPDGFRAGMNGMMFRVSAADGIFSVTKGDIQGGSDLKKFSKDRLIMGVNVPKSVILRNYGVTMESVTGKSETITTFSLPDSGKPLLQAVLEEIYR